MQILILGGTAFLGRHLVDAALANGHQVTVFNRGQTNPNLFPDVEKLRGDRDGNLDAFRGRTWDAVIDTSGYVPRVVRQSVKLLQDYVQHYTFVSSLSVYADFSKMGIDETAPVGKLDDETSEDVSEHYGELKALCEQEVQSGFGERALVIRPGLIVGTHDPTDRFTYWTRRFAEGGEVLVPGHRDRPVQFIDVRDLAEWMITMVENRVSGVFNDNGPSKKLTMQQFVSKLENDVPSSGKTIWVTEDFLLSNGVKEWTELPLWISERTNWPGFLAVDFSKAVGQGLTFRSLRETVLDTLRWDRTRSQNGLKAGLKRDVESELLRKWKAWDGR